jgi:pectate lyase
MTDVLQNLNPSLIWGGDAIDLTGNNNGVWIDHCKVSGGGDDGGGVLGVRRTLQAAPEPRTNEMY